MSVSLAQKAPLERVAEQMLRYYAAHPDLIVALLGKLGAEKVKPHKREIRCTCPIHKGSNGEAFAVWFDRGMPFWKCHTDCADKGSLMKLVMKKYAAKYEQAVVWLCQFAGIQVTGEMLTVSQKTLEDESLESWKRRMGLDPASQEQPNYWPESWVQWSMNQLYQPVGQQALNYLLGRHFPIPVLNYWNVGFVPGGTWVWEDQKDQVKRGWFEDRISMPWRAVDNHCIGFAGRRIDGVAHMKYKTLYGTKRNLALYGLHHPATRDAIVRTKVLYMEEGYTDVWRSHMHGAPNATAVGGTELTPRQLDLIKSFDLKYVIMYMDPDGPGMVAARKIADQVRRFTSVLVATPPGDDDPGDILDPNAFWTPLVQAKPFIPKE